jgi:hypothetical protein
MAEEKDKPISKVNFLNKFKEILTKLFFNKKESDSKETYMDVYKKQSTEKTVRGTQLMLQYVANKGLKISPEIINVITFTKEKIERSKKLTPKEEAKFWIAYSELSNQIQPVTVKSLKCIREEFGVYKGIFRKKKISYAERVQGKYRRWSSWVLFLVIVTQVVWLWQTYLFKQVSSTNKSLKVVYGKLYEKPNDHSSVVEAIELEGSLTIEKKKLHNLIQPFHLLCKNFHLECIVDPKKVAYSGTYEKAKKYDILFEEGYLSNMQALNFSIEILSLYLLPIFYGLLGSCTYILRVIAYEIDKQIYVREHDIQYALRILLGTFAGFVIGWFISSDTEMQNGFSPAKLSPFAIAFVAGYSVELLFTLLDKIVAVYSGAEKKKQEESEVKE